MLDKTLMESALAEIEVLRRALLAVQKRIPVGHPRCRSLLNLRQYLALRKKDRTAMQEKLFRLSLSSLGRSHAHVAASVDALHDQLCSSLGREQIGEDQTAQSRHVSITDASAIASHNAQALFGGEAHSRLSRQNTAVMVTLPSHAAENNGLLIRQLADAGVNAFRINTAHDDAAVWKTMADMIGTLNAERKTKEKIKIFVDLAGPKIRTGKVRELDVPVEIGSNRREKEVIIRWDESPTRQEQTDSATLEKIPAQIAVEKKFFRHLDKEHPLRIIDVNHKKATVTLTETGQRYAEGMIDKKVFIDRKSTLACDEIETFPLRVQKQKDPIRLYVGDLLVITENEVAGRSAVVDEEKNVIRPALIGCTHKGLLASLKEGEKIFIDDGKIGAVVVENSVDSVTCRVTLAKPGGTLLKEEKGINFPDTCIKTPALTAADRANALAVLEFADSLSLSFCQSAGDVGDLQNLLHERGRDDIGIIAKIETRQGIINMPSILEQLLVSEKSGVMIARGDLAIEVGFENMAYVQEALLDICDAAHIPVIWATQVLENKMKNNLPSRAEVTDAAMAGRAECVMLNKGAFAVGTIDILKRILDDMHTIAKKNRQLLRKETLWN